MTERSRRARRSLASQIAVITSLSGAAFLGIFGGLSHQIAASRDPALGPKARIAAAPERVAVSRRIIRRTIVVRQIRQPSSTSGQAPGPPTHSPPRVPAAAPVSVRPPVVSAPAPAPVVTRTS